MDFTISVDYRVKNEESEKIDKYFNFTRNQKNVAEHEYEGDTNCNWYTWNGPKGFGRKTGGTGNQRKNWDYPNQRIIQINSNTPEEFWKFAVAQTVVKDHWGERIAWKDYRKAYERILQIWIIECLKMFKISEKIINFITRAMEN